MHIGLPMVRKLVFAAATLSSLGFGVTQALAAPPETDAKQACTQCMRECPEFGGQYIRGRCYCCG